MADISKIQVPGSATQYNIKDAQARSDIATLNESLGDVRADLGQQNTRNLAISQGYWSIADGTPTVSNNWCRTGAYIPKNLKITSTVPSVRMFLLAYSNGSYVGAWDGTAFSKTYVSTSNMTYIDVEKWLQDFPTYQFKIDFYGGASINPTDCQDALSITTVADALRQQTIELREHVNSVTSPYPLIEQGYWKVIDGTPNVSDTWCRTKTLNAAIALSTSDDIKMVLLAYNQQGEYVGAWNGSTFVKANYSPMAMLKYEFDMEEFSRQYLGYDFKIIFHRVSEATLTVQDVIDNVDVKSKFISTFNVASHILKSNKLYYFPVKTGNAFEVVSLSDVFANWRLKLYDANGEYLTYYNLPSGTSRKINSSSTDFEYVSIIAPLENIDVMVVNHSKPFDNDAFISALEAISTNRRDINVIQTLAQKYSKEKAEAETIVRKYGGNSAPVYADAFFMWITDVHQEVGRTKDFADVVTKFGNDIVPFVLNTGDTVRAVIGDGITWYNDIIESMNVPVLNTVGNHDAYSSIGVLEPDKTVVYNEIIAPFVSEWGVTQPENAAANGYCYYYKDIGAVRLIVLDSEYWDSAQKIWLESVLADSTTNNKHVVIACHAPFSANLCTMIDTAWNTGFLSRDSRIMSAEALAAVQNFKSSGGVFVAWLQGHVHGDEVVTLDNGNQLAICNNSFSNRGTKVYKTNNKTNYNYNSYTMVAIDASNNLLKLYRIGANVSVTGKRHNGFVWNYNTNNLINEW